jgi:riboflavin-specific deaminase-like protein
MELLRDTSIDQDALAELYAWPTGAGEGGGYVRANMASSFDGATAVDGKAEGVSSENDRALFRVLRSLADVVLVGAETVRAEGYGPVRAHGDAVPAPLAVVSGSLKGLDPRARLFTEAARRTILVTTATADTTRFTDVADVLIAGEERVGWPQALAGLADRGLTRVLTEGGPSILGQLASGDHLDEVCLTLSPVLVGGTAKRITEGPPLGSPRSYDLAHAVLDEGMLFLRYVAGDRASRSA